MAIDDVDVRTLGDVATERLMVAKTIPGFKTHKGGVYALWTPEKPYGSGALNTGYGLT